LNAFESGSAAPSFLASWLSSIGGLAKEQKERLLNSMQYTAGVAYLAGYETTTSTLLNFVLLTVTHPEVQRKAHEELDRVIGRNRLPELEDKVSLPYIDALCKEVLRCQPSVPLAIVHSNIVDDEYEGMWIPKGSAVFPNVWAMSRDEDDYGPDADVFRPERFLEADRRDPASFVFGFGRRICPGRYVAQNSIFIFISYVLQMFNIIPAVDENGVEKPINPRWITGLAVHLESFPASFELRFEGAEKLIAGI